MKKILTVGLVVCLLIDDELPIRMSWELKQEGLVWGKT